MNRRQFVYVAASSTIATLFGGCGLIPADSSPSKVRSIGILTPNQGMTLRDEQFGEALRALGWIEGQTITLDYRFSGANPDELARQAADLVARPVDLLVAGGTIAAVPAMRATMTIPI